MSAGPESGETLRALVVDDEPLAARRLARALEGEPGVVVGGVRHDGQEALEAIGQGGFDLVFLDIRMPGLDGMAVARALERATDRAGAPLVVFVTAYSRFAPEAFQVEALDYLLKPVETERLRATLERARERLAARRAEGEIAELRQSLAAPEPASATEIWAPTAHGAVRLPIEQIDWVAAEDDYVRLHAGAKSYLVRATLQDFMTRPGSKDFVRVHRSAAINLKRLGAISRLPYGALAAEMTSGGLVRVSRTHAASLRRRLRGDS